MAVYRLASGRDHRRGRALRTVRGSGMDSGALTVLSIAPLIARAIHEVFDDGSVTSLFNGNV